MADLLARFRLVDEMSDKMSRMADSGRDMMKQWEQAGEATNSAFDDISSGVSRATSAVDGVASSVDDIRGAANRASSSVNNLSGSMDDYGSAAREAASETDDLARATEEVSDNADDAGSSGVDAINGIAGALAGAGITAKVAEIAAAVYDLADSFSEAEKTVIAQTGATGQELDNLMDSSLNVFASSSAESLNDVAASMTTVQTATKLTGDALEEATQSALTLESALGLEVSETTRTAGALMKNFGIEAQQAYDIIAAGAQQGANQNGDLLDVLNEYSAQYAALGLSAEEFISSLVDGADAGVFSVDKVGDAVKEFNIRVKDGSDTTTEAFEMLGMNADTMAARFAAGGETARTAFFEVVNALDSMADPIEKNTAAVNLFGTMYEDLGAGILPVLAGIEGGSVETSNALSSMADEAQSLGDKWQEAGNSISTAFTSAVEPAVSGISGALAEAAQGFGDFLNENPAVTKAITAVGVGLGVVVVGIGAVSVASLTAIPAVAALGTAISAAIWPITAIAAAIAVVSGVVMSLTQDYVEQIRSSGGEASAAAESVAQQIETALATQIDPEVDVDVNYKANTESIEALEIPDKTAEATYELNSAEVDNYVMKDQTAEAEYELNSSLVDAYVPEDKSADAIYDVNSYAVDSWTPPNKTATLTYNIQTVGSVPGHADGTTNAESVFVAGEEGPELVARRAAAYAGGTTNSTDYFIAGENGPELIVGEQGSTVFPTEETNRLIAALNEKDRPLYVPPVLGQGGGEAGRTSTTEQVKRILLEIAGSGAIEVGGRGGADKETILSVLYENLKPVLMNIIQSEIYEEGELTYEY